MNGKGIDGCWVSASGRPAQVVAGTGGTQLTDPIPERVDSVMIRGMAVAKSRIDGSRLTPAY